MNGTVFVLGSINQDIVGYCLRLPAPGETILGTRLDRFPGGKGANQAVAAAQAGCPAVRMLAAVGQDSAGAELLQFLESKRVDVSMVRRHKHVATGTALILVADGGQNSIVVIPGANGEVTAQQLPAMAPHDVCLAQFEVPIETVAALFHSARAQGATTILNPSPFRTIPANLLAETDILVVNESEYASLGGAGGRLADIVTLGKEGVRIQAEGKTTTIPGIRVEAVDSTGAGDCFAGYVAALLAEGLSIEQAARIANAAAALSVTRPGAGSSMPTRSETMAFLEQHP